MNPKQRPARPRQTAELFVEPMEDRCVLSGLGLLSPTTLLNTVVSTANSVVESTPPAALVSSVVGNATSTVSEIAAPLTTPLTETIAPVVAAVSPNAPVAANVAAPIVGAATEAAAPAINAATSLLAPITSTVLPVINPVTDTVATAAAPLTGAVGSVTAPITQTVSAVTAPVTGLLNSILAPVTDVLAPVVSPVLGTTMDVLSPIVGTALNTAAPVLEIVTSNPVVESLLSSTPALLAVDLALDLGALANVGLNLTVGGDSLLGLATDVGVLGGPAGSLLQTGLDAQIGGGSLVSAAASVAVAADLIGLDLGATVGGDQVAVVTAAANVAGVAANIGATIGENSSVAVAVATGATNGSTGSPLIDIALGNTGATAPTDNGTGNNNGSPNGPTGPVAPGVVPTSPTTPDGPSGGPSSGPNAGQQQFIATPLAAAAASVGQSSLNVTIDAEETEEALASAEEAALDAALALAGAGEFIFDFGGWDMSAIASRVLPLLLTVDFSAEGMTEFTSTLGSLLASATVGELEALQRALDSFLADLDVLGNRLAQSAGTIVPWLAVASLAALGASEIVRRDLKRRRIELRQAVAFA